MRKSITKPTFKWKILNQVYIWNIWWAYRSETACDGKSFLSCLTNWSEEVWVDLQQTTRSTLLYHRLINFMFLSNTKFISLRWITEDGSISDLSFLLYAIKYSCGVIMNLIILCVYLRVIGITLDSVRWSLYRAGMCLSGFWLLALRCVHTVMVTSICLNAQNEWIRCLFNFI